MATILLIEDDHTIAQCISAVARGNNHTIHLASGTSQGHGLLVSDPEIALLVLDNHLGVRETGLSFLTHLRRSREYRSLPVIICSADTTGESVSGFMALNIAAFVVKPFRPDRFLAAVEQALERSTYRPSGMSTASS